ncbi:hypothetical protein Q3G72_014035 [Acer saccharum]|nr:hypothetical protein Q3G72_014035 [Acer saccharum]
MEQLSSSLGTNLVDVRQCIEELLKFTLESHLNKALELDLGLSMDFCSYFLKHHPLTVGKQIEQMCGCLNEMVWMVVDRGRGGGVGLSFVWPSAGVGFDGVWVVEHGGWFGGVVVALVNPNLQLMMMVVWWRCDAVRLR